MDKQIIFEDGQIRAIFMQGNSDILVFSFGDLITRAKGLSINAEKSLAKLEYNVIGIMPKEKSWFPEQSMRNMMAEIEPLLRDFSCRVGYGGSMGGYAAIKYSNLLDLQRVVALVPQYSIDPNDIEDLRYNMFFNIDLNQNMRIQNQDIDLKREYIVVYDPYYAEDRAHYLKIQQVISNVKTLHLPYTGHDAIAILASSDLLNDFLIHPFDEVHFYQKMRVVKKKSKFYYRKVIENVLPQHRQALGRILKNNDFQLDSQFFDSKLKQNLIRSLLNNKQVDQHDLEKLGLQPQLLQETRNLLFNHFGHGLVFNIISQKIECYAEKAIELNHKFLIPIYAKSTSLAQIHWNEEYFIIAMNDRQVMKLFKEQDDLTVGMHPILLKKYNDYFVISYQNLNLHSDEFGNYQFVETLSENAKFVMKPELLK